MLTYQKLILMNIFDGNPFGIKNSKENTRKRNYLFLIVFYRYYFLVSLQYELFSRFRQHNTKHIMFSSLFTEVMMFVL